MTPKARSSSPFKEAGGEIVGSVRFPVANPDFSAFVQRAKDLNPEAIFIFDSRRRAAGGARQGARRARHRPEEDQDPGHGELTDERRSRAWATSRSASSPRGTTTTITQSAMNKEFVEGVQRRLQAQSGLLLDRRL